MELGLRGGGFPLAAPAFRTVVAGPVCPPVSQIDTMYDATCQKIRETAEQHQLAVPESLRPTAVPGRLCRRPARCNPAKIAHWLGGLSLLYRSLSQCSPSSLSSPLLLNLQGPRRCCTSTSQVGGMRSAPCPGFAPLPRMPCGAPGCTPSSVSPLNLCTAQFWLAGAAAAAAAAAAAVFRSAVDTWGIQQAFPVMPIHRWAGSNSLLDS